MRVVYVTEPFLIAPCLVLPSWNEKVCRSNGFSGVSANDLNFQLVDGSQNKADKYWPLCPLANGLDLTLSASVSSCVDLSG